MLKKHHIIGIRQTVFSSLLILVIGGGLFFVLKPNVFSHAADLTTNYVPDSAPVYKLPTEENLIENKDINTTEKIAKNTYVVKPQGLSAYIVTSVIDGNTVILENKTRVRLIGIKAPEKDEELGLESYEFLNKMIGNKEVYLQKDSKNPEDQFGRIRGILYTDKKNVNIEILRAGLAHIYPITPSIVGYSDWQAFEDEAREAKRGLWSGEKVFDTEKTDKEAIPTL